jgi:Low-density lipoprotein receptor domain class A
MFEVPVLVILFLSQQQRLAHANNFTCLDGFSIGAGEICDGIGDCADSSDERVELCASVICQPDQFKCYYGACISRLKVCDGKSSCVDGSDEFNCGKANGSCE